MVSLRSNSVKRVYLSWRYKMWMFWIVLVRYQECQSVCSCLHNLQCRALFWELYLFPVLEATIWLRYLVVKIRLNSVLKIIILLSRLCWRVGFVAAFLSLRLIRFSDVFRRSSTCQLSFCRDFYSLKVSCNLPKTLVVTTRVSDFNWLE